MNSSRKWNFFRMFTYISDKIQGTPIYIAGKENTPIFLCLHGAGHSAMSFALLATQVKQYGCLISFDFRGRNSIDFLTFNFTLDGLSTLDVENPNLSAEQLTLDTMEVAQYVSQKFPDKMIIIVGHSMGGSIAAKATDAILASNLAEKIQGKTILANQNQGCIVIDVVEGTAIEALPFMESILSNRPKAFKSHEQAIQWCLNTSQLKNLASARVSMPPQLKEVTDEQGNVQKLVWRVDLKKTDQYWMGIPLFKRYNLKGWFKGLTQAFLSIRIPKILVLAEKERMDKDLTVAQMQGKFRLVVLYDTGHSVMEDDPWNLASELHDFLLKFRVPTTKEELHELKSRGIGGFHPKVKPYVKTK